MDKQIHALSAFDCAEMQIALALALEKIANLEERIRVADAEEPYCWHRTDLPKFTPTLNPEIKRGWDLDGLPSEALYLHAQIPAEVAEQSDTELLAKIDGYEEIMHKINDWIQAYPVEVFPEPDFKKAAQVLKDAGMTLDAISASNMRHVLSCIEQLVKEQP